MARLFFLGCLLWVGRARAADCGHDLTAQLRAHVAERELKLAATREGARQHTILSGIAAPDPIWATNGRILRWNVFTNVPADAHGWAAEGFRRFVAATGQRVEVVSAADPSEGLRGARAITLNPNVESERIWVIVDFTNAPKGSWLEPQYEAMWSELHEIRERFIPEGESDARAFLLPLILIPDDFATLPRRKDDRFQYQRPNVQQLFGFQSLEKYL